MASVAKSVTEVVINTARATRALFNRSPGRGAGWWLHSPSPPPPVGSLLCGPRPPESGALTFDGTLVSTAGMAVCHHNLSTVWGCAPTESGESGGRAIG